MNRFVLLLAVLCVPLLAHAADYYSMRVTRVESNFYRVQSSDLYILTRYCYQYAYGQDAVLVWKGNGSYAGNQLVFLDYRGKPEKSCDVEMLLRETTP